MAIDSRQGCLNAGALFHTAVLLVLVGTYAARAGLANIVHWVSVGWALVVLVAATAAGVGCVLGFLSLALLLSGLMQSTRWGVALYGERWRLLLLLPLWGGARLWVYLGGFERDHDGGLTVRKHATVIRDWRFLGLATAPRPRDGWPNVHPNPWAPPPVETDDVD